ncbi:MAG: LamG-like jellyroll fold domain-containing protein [Planctomycetia bacterium]|nr:LamG-like jellyroll fold domain-containing protein [Planctomycetia bacterium]
MRFFILSLMMCATAFAAQEPVLQWSFDPAPEGIKIVPGVSGNGAELSGKFQISIPATQLPEGMKQVSFTAWVKPKSWGSLNEILRKEDGDQRLLFSFQKEGKVLSMGLNTDGKYGELQAMTDPDFLKNGQWHFVCGTYDGQTFRVWLDGQEIASRRMGKDWKYGGPAPVFLGSQGGFSEWFDGQLDEVRVYDRALSAKDIRKEYLQNGGTFDLVALRNQVREVMGMVLEYEPRTPSQWAKCSAEEKATWAKRKEIVAKCDLEHATVEQLFDLLDFLNTQYDPRPLHREAVAPFHPPFTPEVKDLTADEATQKLEAEWLFQCGDNPTIDAVKNEIGYARKLAKRIRGVDFSAQLKKLDELEAVIDRAEQDEIRPTYLAVRGVKREIFFSNPALDFDTVLYIDAPYPEGSEWQHENHHRVGTKAVPGGRLMTLTGLSPAGKQKKLMPDDAYFSGSFWRPDVSYDGKRILFCFKPYNEKAFHLYEMNADGTGLRQLTDGPFDDLDPVYLPDGENVIFLTGRAHTYVRCVVSSNAFVMARMKLHGGKEDGIYLLSRNMECEYTPCVMNDGRVIYTRWEYTDKPLWRCQSLWTMNPDGTQVQTFWGNQSVWPDLLKDARPLPGGDRVIFTGSGHHQWFHGSIGIIDPGKGLNYPDGLTKVTQEVPWAEVGNGPDERPASEDYHTSGDYTQYSCPYPISDRDFLVSAQRGDKFVLLLMDMEGNRELIYEGAFNIFHAIPLRARPVPPVRQDQTEWPTFATREHPATGIIYSNNVYDNAPPELKGKAKFLRVWSMESKTYTMWDRRPYATMGPATSMVQSDGVKRILGTVPVEDDGSVNFEAPSGVALHFQLLDENHRALQTMRSFTGVMPGEVRGCLGCHESQIVSPNLAPVGKAMHRAPSKITPVGWSDISVSYGRYVQPVLDKYCGKCHQNPESDAFKALNMTRRKGFLFFDEPYVTLTGKPTWGRPYVAPDNPPPGFGWADTILVEGYGISDPKAYLTVPPMTKLSYKSRLVERMANGKHHDVKVSGDDLLRVILWVDAMCPYYGSEELREMDDPVFTGVDWLPVKPRIHSAPVIPRPGPLDALHPEKDSAYACPDMERVNRLPNGIK